MEKIPLPVSRHPEFRTWLAGHVQRDRRLLRAAWGIRLCGLGYSADGGDGARLRAAGRRRDGHLRADRDDGLLHGGQVDGHNARDRSGLDDVLAGTDAGTQARQRLGDPGLVGHEQHIAQGQRAGVGHAELLIAVAVAGLKWSSTVTPAPWPSATAVDLAERQRFPAGARTAGRTRARAHSHGWARARGVPTGW